MDLYPCKSGALASLTKIASEDIVRWVEYAGRHPKDAGYAMRQLLLVADRLKVAEATATRIAIETRDRLAQVQAHGRAA
jgi:hypothetical protein